MRTAQTALASLLATLLCIAAFADDAITLLPARFTVTGPKAFQRLLAEAKQGDRLSGDLTGHAAFASSNPRVAIVGRDGIVRPTGDGTAMITATVKGRAASASVTVRGFAAPPTWSFRNHVLPVLSRSACNSGACHGALAGKGGLKLSLRGFDADADHNVLTRQAHGRRVVAGSPLDSLMLLKPTMQIGHGGGERIKKGGLDYSVVSGWIKAGAPRPRPNDPKLSSLGVYPSTASLKPGDSQQIVVRADYSDGHSEDVTQWVKFGTSDSQVATVDDNGAVKIMGSGEAAITVWFSSKVAFARIVSPFQAADSFDRINKINKMGSSDPNLVNLVNPVKKAFIDALIERKVGALNLPVSPRCTDSEFVRRAFLDVAGILPTVREVRAFLADSASDKRSRLIDSLLTRPEYVDAWTYKWSDLFLVNSKKLGGTALTAFYDYLHRAVEQNKPWDKLAREILTAQGSNLDNGAVNFWVLHKEPIDLTETTTQAFLGMSVQCARCHNHPMEKWTQNQYYRMANLLSRVRLKNDDRSGEVLAVVASDGNINHPRLGAPLPPQPLDGPEMSLDDSRDRRQILVDWLTAPDNPFFAKALVNRVWKHLMGRGLVEAEDDLRLTNPPSNQELFDALAQDFIKSAFDVKGLIREIMLSDSYQRSAAPVGINARDDRYYSHYLVKRLPAEVLLDTYAQVTAVPTEFTGVAKGTRALQLRDSQVSTYFLTAFGRPQREQTCSCERQQETTVAQALHLANGDTLNHKLRAPGGVIDGLVRNRADDEETLEDLYLSALARFPTPAEKAKLLPLLAASRPDILDSEAEWNEIRRPALEDLYWAVLTDREFVFNH
jgi:hypothetical protein